MSKCLPTLLLLPFSIICSYSDNNGIQIKPKCLEINVDNNGMVDYNLCSPIAIAYAIDTIYMTSQHSHCRTHLKVRSYGEHGRNWKLKNVERDVRACVMSYCATALDATQLFSLEYFRNAVIISPTTGSSRHKLYLRYRHVAQRISLQRGLFFYSLPHSRPPARPAPSLARSLACVSLLLLCVHYIFKLNSSRTI